MNKMCFTDTPL